MTDLPSPEDLATTDIALNRIREQDQPPTDPVLAALGQFAQAVDARAQALTTGLPRPSTPHRLPGAAGNADTPRTPRHRSGHATRPPVRPQPRGRRLLAVPIALALALVLIGPLSETPGTPLYPLHQWIFDHPASSPADSTRLNLANANQALDQAGVDSGQTRTAEILAARRHLAAAQTQLRQVTDATARTELAAELNRLEQLADQLDDTGHEQGSDNHRQTGPSTGPSSKRQPTNDSTQTTTEPGNSPTGPDDSP